MAKLEEVFRDLLHPTLEIRKKALISIKELWNMDIRPYLWTVIEIEKDQQFQSEMVDFIIHEIKEKSLRKMIRFVENGQLHKKSMNVLLHGYVAYETPEIRKALIKSLKRENSKTYIFVELLLGSKNLEEIKELDVMSLLEDLFDPSVKDAFRFNFARIMTKRDQQFGHKTYQGKHFRVLFGYDSLIIRAIFLELKSELFIWSRINWNLAELPILEEIDWFLIKSANNADSKVRKEVIKILANQIITFPYSNNSQENIIFDIWNNLVVWKRDEEFISLKNYDKIELNSFFYDEYKVYLDELLMFEIHPYILVNYIIAYLPRKIMLILAKEDPTGINRALCYEGLANHNFWVQYHNNDICFVGPHLIWVHTINRCLTGLKFETEKIILEKCIILLNLFLDLLMKIAKKDFDKITYILEQHGISAKLDELREYSFAAPVVIQMQSLLKKATIIEIGDKLSARTSKSLIIQFLKTAHEENSKISLLNVFTMHNDELKFQIIDEIDNMIKEGLFEDNAVDNIKYILENAQKDQNIRIRAYARLLTGKLK